MHKAASKKGPSKRKFHQACMVQFCPKTRCREILPPVQLDWNCFRSKLLFFMRVQAQWSQELPQSFKTRKVINIWICLRALWVTNYPSQVAVGSTAQTTNALSTSSIHKGRLLVPSELLSRMSKWLLPSCDYNNNIIEYNQISIWFFYNFSYTCMLGYPVFGCFWWILRLFTPPHFPILKGTILSPAPGFVSRDTVNVRIRYTEALSSYNHRSSPGISATINLAVQPTPCPGAKGTRTDRRWKRRICPPLLCLFPNKSTSKSVRLDVEKYEKKNKMPSETSAMETFGPGIPVPQASTCKQSSFWFSLVMKNTWMKHNATNGLRASQQHSYLL